MTSRERFEAWYDQSLSTLESIHRGAWEAWQAAESATARRCVDICLHAAERKEGAWECEYDIRAEYPEAFT